MELTLKILLGVFEDYNLAIWPMQIVAYILGIGVVFFVLKKTPHTNRIILAVLSFLWLWTGVGFFLFAFGPAYTPAYAFGVLFLIQGIGFLLSAFQPRLSFGYRGDVYAIVGLVFVAYAMIGYPAVGYLLGHRYPQSPPFGLTPCPTAAFTFGLYLLTDKRLPKLFLAIPLLWAVGGVIPASIGILEDIGLILSGVVGTAMIFYRDRKQPGVQAEG
jgi:hypothetical protein